MLAKFPAKTTVLALALLLGILAVTTRIPRTAAAKTRIAGRRSAQTAAKPSKPPQRAVHERFAQFFAGPDFKSVFLIENFRQDVSVTVTPSLIVSAGEIALDPVTLAPHSTASVDINAALAAHGSTDTQGTALIRYTFSPYDPITAVAQSSDYTHKLYLNSYAQSPEEYWQGNSYDAALWAPDEDTQGFLSLTNTTQEPRTVRATFYVNGHSEEQEAMIIPAGVPARFTLTNSSAAVVRTARASTSSIPSIQATSSSRATCSTGARASKNTSTSSTKP